jgi:hypothetical protein
MKAEILKLAGVKDEKEFYKKFPTEKAFMAKYGKRLEKLKKAKVGDLIAGDISTPVTNQPLFYNDLTSNAEALVTGVSSQEKQRREALSSQQAIADASAKSNQGGLGDILGKVSPEMIASAFGKNGKKLKKAFGGADVPADALDYMNNGSMPSDISGSSDISQSAFGGIGKFIGSDIGGTASSSAAGKDFDWKGLAGKVAPGIAPIVGAIQQYDQQKKNLVKTKQYGAVSDVVLRASSSMPELSQRRYVRPEDSKINAMNPLGSGTNYLAARNGAEIQNTYAPDVMYTDLEYEPLNDSNKVKDFKKGGKVKKAAGGINLDPFAGIAGNIGGSLGSKAGKGSGKGGPGSTIGSTIGGIAGSFIPIPGVGTALGSLAGGFIGGLFDAKDQNAQQDAQDKLDQNMQGLAFQQGAKNIQQTNKGFMKEGGWVSNDWQPQVITSFGDHSMKDLLAPDPMMDTLRAGGHLSYYTPPSERAMSTERAEYGTQMAMGGDLQVHRGTAEPISYNPYLPNSGETVMFRGPSHDDGGMPISYGNNGVEVEGGEPAMVMKDGGQKDNLLVFGNLLDPMNNRKFKNVAADISKKEAKQNKILSKATALSNNADENNTFGQLELNSAFASDLGAKMNLKKYAMEKEDLAHRQNAILDTAEEFGIKPEDIGYAKFGGKFDSSESFAKGGKKGKKAPASPFTKKGQAALKSKTLIPSSVFAPKGNAFLDQVEKESDQAMGLNRYYPSGQLKPIGEQTYNNPKTIQSEAFRDVLSPETRGIGSNVYENFDPYKGGAKKEDSSKDTLNDILRSAYSSVYPFIRPTAGQPLDPDQLAPEMLATAMNQQEPVAAQLYNPMLTQATSISLQDQLNEVTAQTRAAERLAQGDPSALAMIASQGQQAKSKILGEQFRMNQAEKQRVSDQNINTLNDAQLKNLALLDQQYVRQETGKSKTKEQSIAIAKSIAEKYAQNKAENRKVKVMENMYPAFSFTQDGTAYKNPMYLAGFGPGMGREKTKGSLASGYGYTYDEDGDIIGTRKLKADEVKNGGIVKAFKNF